VAQVVAATLDHMDPAYPPPQADLTEYLDVLE
jgi:hypothetical protein